MTNIRLLAAVAIAASALQATPASAVHGSPDTIELPTGFRPEGIAIGPGPTAYFGSMVDGRIYRVDLRDGMGRVLAEGPGTMSLGMKVDSRGRLFVAGGDAGDARVVDTRTGRTLATYRLGGYVDDVVLTRDAAWFTDATRHQFYRVPLDLSAGFATVPLSGDLPYVPDGINSNGIATTPDGRALLIGHLTSGKLYRVDPGTGRSTEVDLGGESLDHNDGILREGRTLHVAQVFSNEVASVELDATGRTGRVVRRLADPRFDFPTAIAGFRDRLYVVNAGFDLAPSPDKPYRAISIFKFD